MHWSPPGSSVHGILQARILDGLPCPSPGDLPNSRVWSWVSYISCIGKRVFLPLAPPGKPRFCLIPRPELFLCYTLGHTEWKGSRYFPEIGDKHRKANTFRRQVLSQTRPTQPVHGCSPAASWMTDFSAVLKAAWPLTMEADSSGWVILGPNLDINFWI